MTDTPAYVTDQPHPERKKKWVGGLIFYLLLLVILLIGAFFRYIGINWGDFQYLHPDERFLVWVGTDIQPVGTDPETLGSPPNSEEYFEQYVHNFSSPHPSGTHFVLGDGSVHMIAETIERNLYLGLCTRAGSEPIAEF